MIRFRLAQCLCPERHAIVAFAAFEPDRDEAALVETLRAAAALVDPWCGICGAAREAWTYEVRLSRAYRDEAAARADLAAMERANRETRALIDALRREASHN